MAVPGQLFQKSKIFTEKIWVVNVRNLSVGSKKFQEAVASKAADEFEPRPPEWDKAKPYDSIPGPKPLPIPYGNFWRFTSFGTYGTDMIEMHKILRKQYGSIVRMRGMTAEEMLFLYDPTYIETMYRNESVWPIRDNTPSFTIYRDKYRQDLYSEYVGVATSQGKKWQESRSAVNQTMMQPRNTKVYVEPIDDVAAEFVERIKVIRDSKMEVPKNFINELNKWSLESIATVALDTRLGCLKGNLDPKSDAQILINSIHDMFDQVFNLDFKPSPYKYFSTPTWRKYIKTMNTITDITEKQINKKLESLKDKEKDPDYEAKSVLESLYFKRKNPKLAVVMAMDMLVAGVDTTSNSAAAALYYLAKNQDKQEILFQEVKRFLPEKNSAITAEILNEMKYMKACIKESMRLAPIASGNTRRTVKDFVLGDYQIPKGTQLLAVNLLLCHDERYYKNAKTYLPERWLKKDKAAEDVAKFASPFVFLPFGFGPRMCVGRRFAELEMEVIVTKLVRNFKLEYNYGEMKWSQKLLYTGDKPFQFKMEDRPN